MITRDRLVDIVDHLLNAHFEVEGRYEWLDQTTRTRSVEWQILPAGNVRQSVGGECYLTFKREDTGTVVDLRVTLEFSDIDRVRNSQLLERAKAYLERAYVEYRIVEEFADERQRFHVFISTARLYDDGHLLDEGGVKDDIDLHMEVLAEMAAEVDSMVYVGPPEPPS